MEQEFFVKQYNNMHAALNTHYRAVSTKRIKATSRKEAVSIAAAERKHPAVFKVYEVPEPSLFSLDVEYKRELKQHWDSGREKPST